MAGDTYGTLFTVTTFGESHGPAMGCVVDGCPPGLALTEADIQKDLDRRRPGKSRYVTQRKEPDQVKILSGVFEGRTTGTAIGLLVENVDQKSGDYSKIKDTFRPGHADYTYQQKYGIRDYRGGGRSSARETVMRVAAGAIARKYLDEQVGLKIRGYLAEIGPFKLRALDLEHVDENPFFSADPVRDFRDASGCDLDAYGRFCRSLLDRGIYPPPSQFEAWFVSLAHDDAAIDRTAEAASEAFSEAYL